jgi:hypothetical protein
MSELTEKFPVFNQEMLFYKNISTKYSKRIESMVRDRFFKIMQNIIWYFTLVLNMVILFGFSYEETGEPFYSFGTMVTVTVLAILTLALSVFSMTFWCLTQL